MDEIAAEAGVGKPTLYRYFASKDALFVAVFEHALDDLEARLGNVLARESGAESRLLGLVAEIVPTFRQHLVSLRFLDGIAPAADQSKRRIFRERRARIGSYLASAIDDGVRSGEIRKVNGGTVAQLMIGMLRSATATMRAEDDEIGRDVTDVILHGLLPRNSHTGETASHQSNCDGSVQAAPLHQARLNGDSS
jgi:AcrR family transcriptional regulator